MIPTVTDWNVKPTLAALAALAVLLACLCAGCARTASRPVFPEASTLPPQPGLPDPLRMLDGRRVTSREQWVQERRPELQALFEHYMYGGIPPRPGRMEVKAAEHRDFLGGKATLKVVTLTTGAGGAPRIDLLRTCRRRRQ